MIASVLTLKGPFEILQRPTVLIHREHFKMAWHEFEIGETYNREEVVAVCRQRIREGGVVAVEEKKARVRLIESGPTEIVWAPQTGRGWGASPFNQNNWHAG